MVLEVRTCLYGWWTTKGLTSLCIGAEWSAPLLFPFVESISQLAIREIPIFYLVSVAKVWVSHCWKSWRWVLSRGGLYVSKSPKPSKWGVSYHYTGCRALWVKANAALHVDVTGPGIMTVIMSWVAQCFCYDPYLWFMLHLTPHTCWIHPSLGQQRQMVVGEKRE